MGVHNGMYRTGDVKLSAGQGHHQHRMLHACTFPVDAAGIGRDNTLGARGPAAGPISKKTPTSAGTAIGVSQP